MVSVLASNAVESGFEPGWVKDNKPTLAPSTNQHHQYKVGFTNSKIVLIVDLSLYLKTKKLLSVFPLFMTNMLSFLLTRLPTNRVCM